MSMVIREGPKQPPGHVRAPRFSCIFRESMDAALARKDGQDLPVRQTLPPAAHRARAAEIQQSREKTAATAWHGACDGPCAKQESSR
jgi:hypothetical protein